MSTYAACFIQRNALFFLLHTAFLGEILFEEMYLLQKKNTSSKQSQ